MSASTVVAPTAIASGPRFKATLSAWLPVPS